MSTGSELRGEIFGTTRMIYITFTIFTKEIEDIQAHILLSLPRYDAGFKQSKFSKIFSSVLDRQSNSIYQKGNRKY